MLVLRHATCERNVREGRDGGIWVSGGSDLKVVKVTAPEVVVEALHDLPGAVPHAHQHNGEGVVAGGERAGRKGGERGGERGEGEGAKWGEKQGREGRPVRRHEQ